MVAILAIAAAQNKCHMTPSNQDSKPAQTIDDLFDHKLDIEQDGTLEGTSLPTHGGVYLITDGRQTPVFLSYGEGLRRIVQGRLTAPPPEQRSKRTDLRQVARRVYWRDTFSRFESTLVHWQIARVLDPDGYQQHIGFSPSWFLRADTADRIPHISTTKKVRSDNADYIGPFATRRDADAWIHMLEDLFDLCRHHSILEQSPTGEPCAYHEMGKCDAPCAGLTPMDAYRQQVIDATTFSTGNREPRLETVRSAMRDAADQLAFEKAGTIRKTLDRAKALTQKPEYDYITDISTYCWLIIQRAGPRRRTASGTLLKPFYCRHGSIEMGEPVPLNDIKEQVPRWLDHCRPSRRMPATKPEQDIHRQEGLSLVAKFLFQRDRAPGLFFRFDQLPSVDSLARTITQTFLARSEDPLPPDSSATESLPSDP